MNRQEVEQWADCRDLSRIEANMILTAASFDVEVADEIWGEESWWREAWWPQAELTSRCFPGSHRPDMTDGDVYISEWGLTIDGGERGKFEIIWHFAEVVGQEKEDASNYPWHEWQSITRID